MDNLKAFPVVIASGDNPSTNEKYYYANEGMDLRDYFAAKVLNNHTIDIDDYIPEDWELEAIARECYRMADAMLKAREVQQ